MVAVLVLGLVLVLCNLLSQTEMLSRNANKCLALEGFGIVVVLVGTLPSENRPFLHYCAHGAGINHLLGVINERDRASWVPWEEAAVAASVSFW